MGTNGGTSASIACTVAPLLSVRRGAQAVEFYKSAFGAREVHRVEDPGGVAAVDRRRGVLAE
jgi:uncharacterized glyoxalase superfamily protein PhnB